MSKITLETLRADYEAKDAEAMKIRVRMPLLSPTAYQRARKEFLAATKRADKAGRLYVIARDYGLKAAMLYKLSDGAIDPRGAE